MLPRTFPLPFSVFGACWCWSGRARQSLSIPGERWLYFAMFSALILTAWGSAYYHLAPDNARLVWDRLPIMIVFMALLSAVIAERVSVSAGLWLFPVLQAA